MKIDLPSLINFNKDRLAPSNEKLASFTVGQLPKNIMKPFMFISTSKLNITYQKLRDRYEYLRRLEPLTPCDPKCQEGWYWDCETETCKEKYIVETFNVGLSQFINRSDMSFAGGIDIYGNLFGGVGLIGSRFYEYIVEWKIHLYNNGDKSGFIFVSFDDLPSGINGNSYPVLEPQYGLNIQAYEDFWYGYN